MDAIKKKMQGLKTETNSLQSLIADLESQTVQANKTSDQCDINIRDIGKRTAMMESTYDECSNKLIATEHKLEEKEKLLAICEDDIFSLCRRLTLLESESWTAEKRLGTMTIDLANICRSADDIQRRARQLESKCQLNETDIEELEKLLLEARTMFADSEKKLDESTRRLGMMEMELENSLARAAGCDSKILELENELRTVGENMIALEVREEQALEREEKYKSQIRTLVGRLKTAESRTEYGEMNITKLNHRIDDIEDDIVREKFKIQKVNNELDNTFDDIFTKY